jgi:hypothetical protein
VQFAHHVADAVLHVLYVCLLELSHIAQQPLDALDAQLETCQVLFDHTYYLKIANYEGSRPT